MYVKKTCSPRETYDFGVKLAKKACPGQIIALNGEMGCGKTVFAQGFAFGLGIKCPIPSPTFTIVHEYNSGRIPLYHLDVYRISDVDEMSEIGIDDYLFGEGVCLIEWGCIIADLLPDYTVCINIEKDDSFGFNHRIIQVDGLNEI